MADNLLQFRQRIRRYLVELNKETSFWTDTFLNQLFNASYRRRSAQLIRAYEGWFVQTAYRDIEEDKSTYGFPDGVQRLQRVEILRSNGDLVPLERYERFAETNPGESSAVGDQYYPTYRPFANGLILEPTPTEDITNGLRIEYAGLPTKLSGDSDVLHPSFPEIYDELLVLDTVIIAMAAEGIHEVGPVSAIIQLRNEYEMDFIAFTDQRTIARDFVDPFIPWYEDE